MKRNQQMRRALRRSALTVALGMCFASPVMAQNAGGNVFGQAAAGSTVVIENPETGFRREITVSSDGAFRVTALQPGNYRVTVKGADGGTTSRDVVVNAGVGTSINLVGANSGVDTGGSQQLDRVSVVGARAVNPIDVSSTESVTILTAQQIAKIPVPRDTTSVALLAPGTVRGDAAFGNLASFGGASVAENQYYVNGFNITNSFRSLNFSQVPFEAIAEQQIKTGGYGAEFGRSLGGVVNQITKRGTNEFHAGGNIFMNPEGLRAHRRDVYYRDGGLRENNSQDETSSYTASVWASGALIQDKLFAYGLVQYGQTESDTFGSVLSRTNTGAKTKAPSYLLKLDWNLNDSNLLEFTAFSDKRDFTTRVYENALGALERGALVGTDFSEQGGDNYVLRYTGYLSDNFTLSALYGHGEFSRSQRLRTAAGVDVRYGGDLNNPATGCPVVVDARSAARQAITGVYASSCNISGGAIDREDSKDERDQFRIDADWTLGSHQLRFGIDVDDYTSIAGTSLEGGRQWRYSTSGGRDIVRERVINQGATVEVKQRAFYVQDNWNITDNFIAYLGGRWDTFENLNGDGDKYVDIKNQFGPRLGFSWDVNGDSSFKVYGNAGRYALPLTPSVAVRGASASLFTQQTFFFTGVDPVTGAPIGLTPRTSRIFVNGEFGDAKNPATIATNNLKPMYQDEYILGFQKAMNSHINIGARGIYRDLKTAIDDNCDYTAVLESAGFTQDTNGAWVRGGREAVLPNAGFPYCRMFNPGQDATVLTDFFDDGNLETTTIPGDRLSPKARRTYKALELFSDITYDKLFIQASYTWAQSKGNTEGGVKSDIGQADTSVTQDFDYKELTVDTYGFLPNDRRHSLKVFGNYEFNDEWSMGANLLVQSGRPVNCFGTLDLNPALPTTNPVTGAVITNFTPHPYGSSFMRCATNPDPAIGGTDDATVVRAPRGTQGRLPWTNSLDLNFAYRPAFVKGLQFKVDVFNVFNHQKVTSMSEVQQDASSGQVLRTYRLPTSFQAPRAVRFMVQYDF
ncbi:TonB-dependent receptor [Lysobacter xanthus]